MKKLPAVLALLVVFVIPAMGMATEVQPRMTDGPIGVSPLEGRFLTAPGSTALAEFALPVDKSSHEKSAAKPEVGGVPQIGYSRRGDVEKLNQAKGKSVPIWTGAGGGKTTVLAVTSPGAEALRVGLLLETVPKGLRIRVGSKASWETGGKAIVLTDEWMTTTYGQAPFVLWTPVSEGDQQLIEFWLPESSGTGLLKYQVEDISHIYDSPFLNKSQSKLLSCEQNYMCTSDPSIQQAGKAVAKLVKTTSAGSFLCSGALLNDRGSTGTPFFMTANHCLSTTAEASSLQFFWFYEQACGGTALNPAYTTSVGSQLLRTDRGNDFTFLRVTGGLPGGLWWLGWNPADLNPGDLVYGVHHPAGEPKGFSTGALNTILPSITFRGSTPSETWTISSNVVFWQTGITEGGSSGSPLLTGAGIFRGALSAAPAGQTCTSSQRISNYSRFSQMYPLIQFWLDPAVVIPEEADSAAATFTSQPNDYTTIALNAQINYVGDQDWFRFRSSQAGVWIVATLPYGNQPSIDTFGRIYAADGTTLLFSNDDEPLIAPNFAFAVHVLGATGAFVQVTGKGSTTGKYILASLFVPDDDHSNFFPLADALAPNASATGTINYGGDSDKFAIDITSSGTLKIESSGSTDTVGLLYNTSLQLVTWNDDIVQGVNTNFSLTANVTPGRYYLDVIGYDVDVTGPYSIKTTFTAGSQSANYQGVWWAGASENGWGLSMIQHGNTLVAGWYYYGPTGQPTWAIMPGCNWNASFTSCIGNVVAGTGAWLGNYTTTSLVQNQIGTVTFAFNDTNNGTMQFTVNGSGGTKNISKLNFASGTAPSANNYTDVWWGGTNQSGWGVALFQQQATLAGAWYTYTGQGQPVWYLISGGSWTSATTHTAQLTRATGSPVVGATYNPAAFNPANAGTITFSFTDANNATMTYSVDGVIQTKSISRFAF